MREGSSPAPDARPVPISSQQRGLWFIQQSEPACGAYHLTFTAHVTGGAALLDRAESVLCGLIAENDVLRICATEGADGPRLWVLPQVRPDVRVVDSRSADDESLRRAVRDAAREPFDLARAPLWRV